MASTPTEMMVIGGEKNCQDVDNKVLHRPPVGKPLQEKCQCKHQPPSAPQTQQVGLGTAQFLFEPAPPADKKPSHRSSSPHVRKIQSAKARLAPSSSATANNSKDSTRLPQGGVRDRQRPNSANVPPRDGRTRHRPGSSVGNRPVPKQFLTFDAKEDPRPRPDSGRKFDRAGQTGGGTNQPRRAAPSDAGAAEIKRWKERKKEDIAEKAERPIPEGIAQLRPWLTEDVPMDWCGVDPSSCLIFLPSFLQDGEDLPLVPPVQRPDDDMPRTEIPPPPKTFDPKKLFHYDVEKHIPPQPSYDRRSQTRLRQGIYAEDGSLLHDETRYLANRTEALIRKEIEDLENLLHGIGNADSSNVMVQYQAEISNLQWSVKDTLVKCLQIEGHFAQDKPAEPSDLLGLRAYLKERETVLNQIRARREACLLELERLESEVGMSMQSEVLRAFKRL